MKNTIGKDLGAYATIRLARNETEEMMPLEHLVKKNAVKKPTKANSDDDRRQKQVFGRA
jgi:hypothetical protein